MKETIRHNLSRDFVSMRNESDKFEAKHDGGSISWRVALYPSQSATEPILDEGHRAAIPYSLVHHQDIGTVAHPSS